MWRVKKALLMIDLDRQEVDVQCRYPHYLQVMMLQVDPREGGGEDYGYA